MNVNVVRNVVINNVFVTWNVVGVKKQTLIAHVVTHVKKIVQHVVDLAVLREYAIIKVIVRK